MLRSATPSTNAPEQTDDRQYSTLEVRPLDYSTLEVNRNHFSEADTSRYPYYDAHSHANQPPSVLPVEAKPNDGLHVVGEQYSTFEDTPTPRRKISVCGLRVRIFWIALSVAIVLVVGAIAGGVAGGLTSRKSNAPANDNNNGEPTSGNSSNSSDPNAILANTRLASTNFTDEFGFDNYLLLYQLNSKAIYLSAFNSSNAEWTVSPIIDGTTETGGSLDDVIKGTALSIDIYRHSQSSRDTHIYWQSTSGTVRTVLYSSNMSTSSAVSPDGWIEKYNRADFKVAGAGASIVSYAHGCDWCVPWTYYFCQLATQRITGAWRSQTANNGQPGWEFIDFVNGVSLPASNTSIALAPIPSLNNTPGLSLFTQSDSGALTQLTFDGESSFKETVLNRGFDSKATIVAFSTGFNDNGIDNPLGFQVLSVEVSAPVYLTYYQSGSWTSAGEVSALSDCSARASMAANQGQRIYCVVGDDDGVEIVEWSWQADPNGNSEDFDEYKRIGTVKTSV
ncbi:hypothetical protein ANO14919_006240 [Xylariales sp. No.14919]|nr:hypothetical protein ANO14919_006240 [Xylariales sp. No.14919]